jgi:Domain of unknown function (DUF4157)
VEQRPNTTGMPDALKAGIEHLSGYSLDPVRVHYNSPNPAQIQAHAYTQGSDIHIAPGQAKHLPHEAWHVVQQAQGRVKPTMQMKGINVNDDLALEKEADIMGEKSLRTNSSNLDAKNNLGSSRPIVQRAFNPTLKLNSFNKLEDELVAAGYTISKKVLLMRWFAEESANQSRVLDDLSSIAAAIRDYNSTIIPLSVARVEPPAKVEPTPAKVEPTARLALPAKSPAKVEPTAKLALPSKPPAKVEPTAKLALPSKPPAKVEPTAKLALPGKPPAKVEPTVKFEPTAGWALPAKPELATRLTQPVKMPAKLALPAKPLDKVEPEEEVSVSPLIINYVWLGNRALGPLEKFNIYSWRALGHTVNIYTHPFAGRTVNTETDLDLEPGDAKIINLREILGEDDEEKDITTPKAILGDTRSVLKSWLTKIPTAGSPTIDHIYNMVDITKSYIGGTRRGIVLDMKVGPSEHLPKYAKSFNEKFISYSRGGKTMSVENQSMGTMQESDELRKLYATKFNARIKMGMTELMSTPTGTHFNLITGYHQGLFIDPRTAGKTLDVATKSPTGEALKPEEYSVMEPTTSGAGPFRVFKAASEQTNSGKVATTPQHIRNMADEVLKKQLSVLGEDRAEFVEKARRARDTLPTS